MLALKKYFIIPLIIVAINVKMHFIFNDNIWRKITSSNGKYVSIIYNNGLKNKVNKKV